MKLRTTAEMPQGKTVWEQVKEMHVLVETSSKVRLGPVDAYRGKFTVREQQGSCLQNFLANTQACWERCVHV